MHNPATPTHTTAALPTRIVQVAVPVPLYTRFDYLLPGATTVLAGCRVRVPFGRRQLIGVVLDTTTQSALPERSLKVISALIDAQPVLPADMLALLQWAADYYHHPIGEVMHTALPAQLRNALPNQPGVRKRWTARTNDATATLARAPRQYQLYQLLCAHPHGLDEQQLNQLTVNWRSAMQALVDKDLVSVCYNTALPSSPVSPEPAPILNGEQQNCVTAVRAQLHHHGCHLLHGITGSGKTEVYLALASATLAAGKQVLVLVPEISLTPQLTARFVERLGISVAVLHSGMNDEQRFNAWHHVATDAVKVLIGTRSAVFTPMPTLGLIIVDEEHDGSFKQQEGFRYHARDLAMLRAQRSNIPIILGSATPSLESLHNCARQRYQLHRLQQRAGSGQIARIELMDMRNQKLQEGLSPRLLQRVRQHLDQQGQVLLFLNRRGFAPLLMCHACGWTTQCQRCDAHMTYHQHQQQLHCHHCGAQTHAPTHCGDCGRPDLLAIGAGTERIETHLQQLFPTVQISRIDRDTTRRKGSLQTKLAQAHSGGADLLVGTQLLAKGHDFPNLTLVCIIDCDQSLYSSDFRAAEHLAQLIIQVAGRAGRAAKPGEVLIQTHHPDHALLQTLLHKGYAGFAEAALAERRAAQLPPLTHLVILRCEAINKAAGDAFMRAARQHLDTLLTSTELAVFGPVSAPMERRAGRYRSQLLLQATQRKPLHLALQSWLPQLQQLKQARAVRWSIDVDPHDTY
jgi:primosomal protein N' (replication factor Y)